MKKMSIFIVLIVLVGGVIWSLNCKSNENQGQKERKSFYYVSEQGEKIEVLMYGTQSVEVRYKDSDKESFTAELKPSASGSKYVSKDGKFVFWSKGKETTIFKDDESIVFEGHLQE